MTIPTPTSEARPPLDEGVLSRLAGELFGTLTAERGTAAGVALPPGASATALAPQQPPAPPAPVSPLQAARFAPSAPPSSVFDTGSVPTPHASAFASQPVTTTPVIEAAGSQSVPSGAQPALAPRAQGVPIDYAAALPLATAPTPGPVGGVGTATPSAPGGYYFLNERQAPGGVPGPASAPGSASAVPGTPAAPGAVAGSPTQAGQPGSVLPDVAPPSGGATHQAPGTGTTEVKSVPSSLDTDWTRPRSFESPGQDRVVPDLSDILSVSVRTQPVPSAPTGTLDVGAIRRDFPILSERINGKQLVWFDNAATTQKPRQVIERLAHFYEHENSNIHRAAHTLAARATDAYEDARQTVADFIGAASAEEIIFVRGTTEAINLVAKSWGRKHVGEGDEIIVSHLEHHANIVPWQQLAAEKGAVLRVIPVDDTGQVCLDSYRRLLGPRTKLVSVTQVSNALGTIVPVEEIVGLAKAAGVTTLVDGAQSVAHLPANVAALGVDFFVFSGHKIFGPTGIGAVYGRREVLEQTPPWQGGGNMIADVTFERTVYQPPPARFEAGTGNIADAAGLATALRYLQNLGLPAVAAYEHELLEYATAGLHTVRGLRLIGTALSKASVLSFVLKGYTTEEVGRALNEQGIAVRAGHHCAQPILRRFGLETTVRPSLALYNTRDEVDHLVSVLRHLAQRG